MVQTIQASSIKELGELVDLFGLEQSFDQNFSRKGRRICPI